VSIALSAGSPTDNRLLAELPRADIEALVPHGTLMSLARGVVLCEVDDEVDEVYFPLSGMISLVIVMKTGKAIETATIGREGTFGAMAGLGIHLSQVRAIIQHPMEAFRVAAPAFRKLVAARPAIALLCIRYNEVLLAQARITAACNALHPVEARFCRWLLQTSDRARSNEVELTQEFLSEMLGVRRTSVTEVAGKMQARGLIGYSRGNIKILDRAGLKALSCECYETLRVRAPS
jgi:CRP-like cAMP-binding protein